jgi:hypothetical protein
MQIMLCIMGSCIKKKGLNIPHLEIKFNITVRIIYDILMDAAWTASILEMPYFNYRMAFYRALHSLTLYGDTIWDMAPGCS